MHPLFSSTPPQSLPPHLQWHVPDDKKEHVGKALLLAGKPITLHTHRVGRRTWPCLSQFARLGRECPHCDRSRRSTTWVPLIACAPPFKRIVLMGGETTWKSVENIPRGSLVECHFARTLRPTLVFTKHVLQIGVTVMTRAAEEIPSNGDITRWLLHYWQWPQLTEWFGELHRESLKLRTLRERAELHGMEVFTGRDSAAG